MENEDFEKHLPEIIEQIKKADHFIIMTVNEQDGQQLITSKGRVDELVPLVTASIIEDKKFEKIMRETNSFLIHQYAKMASGTHTTPSTQT